MAQAADEEELSAEGLDRSERQISVDEGGLRQLDERILQAMANMDFPQQWTNIDSQPKEGNETGNESAPHKMWSCKF